MLHQMSVWALVVALELVLIPGVDSSKSLKNKLQLDLRKTIPNSFCRVSVVKKVIKRHLKKREGVPEMGTKPPKALRGHRASNRGSQRLSSRL